MNAFRRNVSRRNVLFGLGSLGATAALPLLEGCRKQSSPKASDVKSARIGNPAEVRILLEGAWVLTAPSNASKTMQAFYVMDMLHVCNFGVWSENGFVGKGGSGSPDIPKGSHRWSVTLPEGSSPGTFQTVVNACRKANGILINDKNYKAVAQPGKDFILNLPSPASAEFGLPYKHTVVSYNSSTLKPQITAVLHYPVPAGSDRLTFQTGNGDFGDVSFAAGTDVILRMMHWTPGASAADDCKHIQMFFTSNLGRIVDSKGNHPEMTASVPDLEVDPASIGNIEASELGYNGSVGSQSCSTATTAQLRLMNETLANCVGGNFVVGDGN